MRIKLARRTSKLGKRHIVRVKTKKGKITAKSQLAKVNRLVRKVKVNHSATRSLKAHGNGW